MGLPDEHASDPLPSWNEGAPKAAIKAFVRAVTDTANAEYVPPQDRIAVFDQDGTLWVEQPIPTQAFYCLDRVTAAVAKRPELKETEPFKTLLSGRPEDLVGLTMPDLIKVVMATLTGMTTDAFEADVRDWVAAARDRRWDRPYTDLIYQPMLEVLNYLRQNDFRIFIVTGGGLDFVRIFAERVYGIPPEKVVGSMVGTKFGYDEGGAPVLNKEPTLMLLNDHGGKPEGIHMAIGRRPRAAFGNSTGDREMLEWTAAGGGASLKMLLLHDDGGREYAYGPIDGMPAPMMGEFTQELRDQAHQDGWSVVSMRRDWKRVFAFDPASA
jgi:phosphoglycolate phosphatase-like HAD superfamily hydrolase